MFLFIILFYFLFFVGVFVAGIVLFFINCLIIDSPSHKRTLPVDVGLDYHLMWKNGRDVQSNETRLPSSSSSYITTTSPNTNNRRNKTTEITTTNTVVQRATNTSSRMTSPPCLDPFLDIFRRQNRFLYSSIKAGLGNRLFVYASVYGIAVQCNRTMVILKSDVLKRYFNLEATQVDECVIQELKTEFIHQKQASAFDTNLFHLPADKNFIIGYYLQSWKYFENVVPQLKKQFTFKVEISKRADEILSNISTDFLKTQQSKGITVQNITFVGIHVRRGDIVTEERFVTFGYRVAPVQYINKAMKYFTDRFNTVLFVVCSDNMKWTKDNIKHPNVVFVHDKPEVDMSVLIHCNHTIITVGTFGWWAGFMAGGITVYYKHPARNGSEFRKTFSSNYLDYFYPGWIAVE